MPDSPIPSRHLRILVVEESRFNQALATRILENRGHWLMMVSSGKEALAALEKEPFDLVLMQVQMADMDGFEVTSVVRRRRIGQRWYVPIIGMTSDPQCRQHDLRSYPKTGFWRSRLSFRYQSNEQAN